MLISCASCGGFVPAASSACPNCETRIGGRMRRAALALAGLAGGGAFLVTLAACYGAPRHKCTDEEDKDKDGYCGVRDCDETNPKIRAYAQDDLGDGVDQNCDGVDGMKPRDEPGSASGTSTSPP